MHCTESMETDQPADDIVISKLVGHRTSSFEVF